MEKNILGVINKFKTEIQEKHVFSWIMSILSALALGMSMDVPDFDYNTLGTLTEIMTNFIMSIGDKYFQISILAIMFWLVDVRIRNKVRKTKIMVSVCCLLSLLWVMGSGFKIDNSLIPLYLTAGQRVKTVIEFLGIANFLWMFAAGLSVFLEYLSNKSHENVVAQKEVKRWRKSVLLILFLWIPHIALAYPASMCNDAWIQLSQFWRIIPFSDHHTTTHTWLVGMFSKLGAIFSNGNLGLFIFIIFQSLVFAMVLAYGIVTMQNLGMPRLLIGMTYCIAAISPLYTTYIGTILKDNLYSYAFLIFVIELIYLVQKKTEFWKSKRHIVLLEVSMIGIMLLRKNGKYLIYIMIFLIMSHLIRNINGLNRNIVNKIVVLCLPVLLANFVSYSLDSYYNVEKSSLAEGLSLPFQQTARYVTYHEDEITQEESRAIDRVLDYDELENLYNPFLSDPVKATYRNNCTKADLIDYFRVWFRQLLKHPACYLSATINQNYFLLFPLQQNNKIYVDTMTEYQKNEFSEIIHMLGVSESSITKSLSDVLTVYYKLMFKFPIINLFSNMSIYIYMMIWVIVYSIDRKLCDVSFIALPNFLSFCMIILAPTVVPRYAFPIIYSIPIMVSYYVYRLRDNTSR